MPKSSNPFIISDLTNESTQSTPDCFVRIIRYLRRDTRIYKNHRPEVIINKGRMGIRHKLPNESKITESGVIDIASDIISCIISKTKSSHIGTFTLTLSPADINYHHAIHPGDHIFIWMKRNRAESVQKNNGLLSKKITNNKKKSGLKLYGVITGIRRIFRTMPNGKKIFLYRVTGKDFGYFFDASVYYNPVIGELLKDKALGAETQIGKTGVPLFTPDALVTQFINVYMGTGPKINQENDVNPPVTENKALFVPDEVKMVLPGGKTLSDLLIKRAGVEDYDGTSASPTGSKDRTMAGVKIFHIDIGAQYKLWSVLQAYANLTINEMFLDMKLDKKGNIRPTFTLRQIPFTTSRAKKEFDKIPLKTTTFKELPRTKIPETFIISEDIGRGDHERFNFIQLYGTYPGIEELVSVSMQVAMGNYSVDLASIRRYGLRTLIPRTDYHFPDKKSIDNAKRDAQEQRGSLVPEWINLLTDWWLGAHIYDSGTMNFIGLEEPISVGDNIEIIRKGSDVNELYHIEGYQHSYSVDPASGRKSFKTSLSLTRGQRVDEFPVYASGQLNEEDVLDIGLSDVEFENTSRSGQASTEDRAGLDSDELPLSRKKKDKRE